MVDNYSRRVLRVINKLIYYLDSADIVTDHVVWSNEEREKFLEYTERASRILREVRDRLREQLRRGHGSGA